jgi:hypothetical protein
MSILYSVTIQRKIKDKEMKKIFVSKDNDPMISFSARADNVDNAIAKLEGMGYTILMVTSNESI